MFAYINRGGGGGGYYNNIRNLIVGSYLAYKYMKISVLRRALYNFSLNSALFRSQRSSSTRRENKLQYINLIHKIINQ